MKFCKQRTGAILIDFLIAMVGALLVGSSLVILIKCTYTSQSIVAGDNLAYAGGRKALDVLSAHLANAQPYQTSSSPVTYSVLSAGAATSVTCYTNSTGDTERYWLDTTVTPPALKLTKTVSGVATTSVVVNGIQSLQFTYYLCNGSNYNSAAWLSNTTMPTASNLPTVGAVNITATATVNGYQQQISSFIRLRNSPYRS